MRCTVSWTSFRNNQNWRLRKILKNSERRWRKWRREIFFLRETFCGECEDDDISINDIYIYKIESERHHRWCQAWIKFYFNWLLFLTRMILKEQKKKNRNTSVKVEYFISLRTNFFLLLIIVRFNPSLLD